MDGFINLLKPAGITSSSAVVKVRRALAIKKVGHMGTLDPDATGVLPIAVGRATRLFDFLQTKRKTYRAEFVFGTTTDTLDASGKITETSPVSFSEKEFAAAVEKMTGELLQVPPAYSAKSVGGVRSYQLARQGKAAELKPKKVTVFDFSYLGKNETDEVTAYLFEITCSGGTYIRSLARDMASILGTVGYMKSLCRTASGSFKIEESVPIEDITPSAIIPLEEVLVGLPVFEVPTALYKKLSDGIKLDIESIPPLPQAEFFSVYCCGELFGLGAADDKNRLTIKTNLRKNK